MGSIRKLASVAAPALEGPETCGFRRYAAFGPMTAAFDEAPEEPPALPERRPIGAASSLNDIVAEALRFRAALREAFERELESLCGDLAVRVLARDLRLAPADIERIARAVLEHRGDAEAIALRAAPDDARQLQALVHEHGLALCIDEAMERGDVVLELRAGSLESSLVMRLDAVLAVRGGMR